MRLIGNVNLSLIGVERVYLFNFIFSDTTREKIYHCDLFSSSILMLRKLIVKPFSKIQ